MKVLVINGPNLNMLGLREPDIYGDKNYNALVEYIEKESEKLNIKTKIFQSNHEGVIVDEIQNAYGKFDGIIINPAAYTHTSVAILDALKAVNIPAVEVHLSDVSSREDFRQISYVRSYCQTTFAGFGFEGYKKALIYLKEYVKNKKY